MNTWRIINLLLRPSVPAGSPPIEFKMVHSAVQVDCPPDLLRYIIETKTAQVLEPEPGTGRLPLHCAAAAMPKKDRSGNAVAFPAYLSKFIVDELLYASPEAASTPYGDGKLPLNLAIDCGKSWIGGGIKSLVDADPESLEKIDLDQHPEIRKAISFSSQFPSPSPTPSDVSDEEKESSVEGGEKTIIKKEEHHDAVMLVQKSDANIRDIVSCMGIGGGWSRPNAGMFGNISARKGTTNRDHPKAGGHRGQCLEQHRQCDEKSSQRAWYSRKGVRVPVGIVACRRSI